MRVRWLLRALPWLAFYVCIGQPEASLDLPTDGGEGDLNRNCY